MLEGGTDQVLAVAVRSRFLSWRGPGSLLTVMLLIDDNWLSVPDQLITIAALAIVLAILLAVFCVRHDAPSRKG